MKKCVKPEPNNEMITIDRDGYIHLWCKYCGEEIEIKKDNTILKYVHIEKKSK